MRKSPHFQLTALAILLLLAACNNNNEFERVMSTWPDGSNQIVFVMKGNEKKAIKIAERRYYENGQLQYEKHFSGKDSHLDGKALYYYPTGEIFASGDYSHNHTKGNDWSILDRQGNHYLQGDFDSIIISDFSEYGTPATVIFYQANTQFTYQFYSNCALRSSGKTVDGKREGPWLFYHPPDARTANTPSIATTAYPTTAASTKTANAPASGSSTTMKATSPNARSFRYHQINSPCLTIPYTKS